MGNVGTIKATINSAASIQKLGHTVKLYRIFHEWDGYEALLEQYGIEVVDLGLSRHFKKLPQSGVGFRLSMLIYSIFSFGKLKQNWKDEKPDVIIASLLGYLPLMVRRYAKHKPIMINSVQGRPRLHHVRKAIWKVLYGKSDLIITLSDETRTEILQKFPFPKDKVVRLDNPVIDENIDELAKESLEDSDLGDAPFVLGVGRLTRQKDFGTLILAFAKVKEQYPYHKLLILGEGEDRKSLEALIAENNLQGSVILKGFVKNPYKYMARTEAFVLSSLWEDAGHVLLEAAYMKAPIVSTRCPSGQEEFLGFGKGGELCEVGNVMQMAESITKVLSGDNHDKREWAYQKSLNFKSEVHGEHLNQLLLRLQND